MENLQIDESSLDQRLAERLKDLRAERRWSLDDLAERTHVSRATLSRLENGSVSPTASVLGKLCSAYGLTMSRLMYLVEETFDPLVRYEAQSVWTDEVTGFTRRSVSPPSQTLAGEAITCELKPGTRIAYDDVAKAGLEHHLLMIEGELDITVDGRSHNLLAGDCLRYQLFGASSFATPEACGAKYVLFVV